MEVTGSVYSQASRQAIWDALMSPQIWKEAIPEAEKYELVGENLYETEVKVDIGPIKGNQTVQIQFSELQPPDKCNFELINSLVKSAKGSVELKSPTGFVPEEGATPPTETTVTVLQYMIDLDAGNPFFNAMLEGFKGKIKEGFEELLGHIVAKAQTDL